MQLSDRSKLPRDLQRESSRPAETHAQKQVGIDNGLFPSATAESKSARTPENGRLRARPVATHGRELRGHSRAHQPWQHEPHDGRNEYERRVESLACYIHDKGRSGQNRRSDAVGDG